MNKSKIFKSFLALVLTVLILATTAFSTAAMQIFVETSDNKIITLDVEQTDTVGALKAKIQEQEGTPTESQKILFGGIELEDSKTLLDYNIQKDSTLNLELVYKTSTINGANSSASADLILNFVNDSVDYSTVYSVDVVWDGFSFVFSEGTVIWNPLEHSYNTPTDSSAGWSNNTGKIVVYNHSNAAVNVDITYVPDETQNGTVTFKVDNTSYPLASAVGTTIEETPKGVSNVTVEGIPENDDHLTIGKITVAVNSTVHKHSWSDGVCTSCGEACTHSEYVDGLCTVCGKDMFAPPTNASVYSGTPDISWYTGNQSEYVLTTADQLAGLNKLRQDNEGALTFEGITIKLDADMIMNPGTMEEIVANGDSNKAFPLVDSAYPFGGTFDGQGHTVSGVYVDSNASGEQGMLGSLGGNASVKDLNVINSLVTCPTVKDKSTIGTLASKIEGDDANVTISNVVVHSTIKEAGYETAKVGGIVGLMSTAGTLTMDNCDFYGSVTTTGRSAGGIVGATINLEGTVNITNCENHGNITANVDAGGIMGTSALKTLNFKDNTNSGTVTSPTCQGDLIGYMSSAPVGETAAMRTEPTSLRVMSFNLQADYEFTDGEPSPEGANRMAAVQQEIQLYSPDIVAVQEDYARVLNKFTLTGYSRITPNELTTGMSNCAIFYKNVTKKASGSKYVTSDGSADTVALTAADVRTGAYKLTSAELKELGITSSTTNEQMRNLTTAASGTTKLIGPKQITWGVFTVGGKYVICVNVHLQHRSQNAAYSTPAVQKLRLMERLKQLAMVQDQINTLKENYPTAEVVIMGDFNDLVGTETYLELRDKYGYSSAHEVARERYGVSATWNNAFKLASQGATYPSTADRSSNSMLDFCFVSSGLQVLKFRVGAGYAPYKYQTYLYTSDHLPIITDLYFGTTIPEVDTTPSVYSGEADTSWYKAGTTSYTLTTADQFVGLNKLRKEQKVTFDGVTIKLGADIVINEGTLEEVKARGSANETLVVTGSDMPFMGIFDGQGHSISGVYFSTGYNYRGIFGSVGGNAQIKNFVLENSYFAASTNENTKYFGMIVGLITTYNNVAPNVSLSNIIIASSVLMEESTYSATYVGGFVGHLSKGKLTMNNCHLNGKVYFPNSERVAGFVGLASSGTTLILNSSHGTGSVTGKNYVAGLAIIDSSDETLNKNNKGSCLMGSVQTTNGSNKNASFIKVSV